MSSLFIPKASNAFAAIPLPSRIIPNKICSVPILLCFKRIASSWDKASTFCACSVNLPNIMWQFLLTHFPISVFLVSTLPERHPFHSVTRPFLHNVVKIQVVLKPYVHLICFVVCFQSFLSLCLTLHLIYTLLLLLIQ